ncbi:hypothetical protein BH23PLA1_BH23PLA1_41610 [soil metagenome]
MYCVAFVLAFAAPPAFGDDWTPPENPDPQAILQEAREDTQAKRFETALAKHVWFHDNALSIRPSLYGVRLSFALAYWAELAEQYPPALTKLKEMRDQARQEVLEGNDVRESFHDMNAINRQFGEPAATKEVFETLDAKNPELAKQVFDLAKPALVRAKAYSLLGKYVDPKADFALITLTYSAGKKRADDPRFGARHLDFANKKFANDVTTLVAILAVNDRTEEAEAIAKSARAEWEDRAFHDGLEQALAGVVPDPWP